MYLYLDRRQTGDEIGPALPDGVGFRLVASPCERASWALYAVSGHDELDPETIQGAELVSDELETLLHSAERFPPALACACERAFDRDAAEVPSRVEFARRLADVLRESLASQATSGWFLAESRVDELGYRRAGGFYWIVAIDHDSGTVRWVSDDYEIYSDSLAGFEISAPVES